MCAIRMSFYPMGLYAVKIRSAIWSVSPYDGYPQGGFNNMKSRNQFICLSRFLAVAIIITITSVNNFAFAQESEEESDFPAHTLGEVVVTERILKIPTDNTISTKTPLPLWSTPASVGVVTSSLFVSQDSLILGDALKNISGVNVQTGFGVHDFFIIRGFDSLTNGLVLTDGALEPEVTFYNLYNIDRIEV